MSDFTTFETALHEALIVYRHKRILLACSGGVDSVLLAHSFKHSRIDFALAHVNYGLRGEESLKDAEFVGNLASDLGVEIYTKSVQLNTAKSIQEEARNVRYQWFDKLCEQYDFDFIATAHHLDDSIEGMVMSVFSGASLNRLSGISDRSNIIRPLQNFSKAQLVEYAHMRQWNYREDSSNIKNDYLRNFVRNQVLAGLEARNQHSKKQLLRSLQLFKQQKTLNQAYRKRLEDEVVSKSEKHSAYTIDRLVQLVPLDEHLKLLFEPLGFTDFKAIEQLMVAENGKEVSSALYESKGQEIDQAQLAFRVRVRNDLDQHAHLEVRLWNSEDRIRLNRLKGSKKVSKLLRDLKIDPIAKSSVQVLLYNGRLLALLGHAVDVEFMP
ncbi:MAG: tRNA lysidine(34) synthetase TilS, partial [Flavobacteriaceae bacterium]